MRSVILLDVWLLRVWPGKEKKKLSIYISRQKDICFTLIYGPLARKINSTLAAREWVKDPVLCEPHHMNLKQDINSDGLKMLPQFGFTWKKKYAE